MICIMTPTHVDTSSPGTAVRLLLGIGVLGIGLALGWAVVSLPPSTVGLGDQVQAHLAQSGARNPVTAVILNFRGYDTLLETGVLLLTALGVWLLQASAPPQRLRAQGVPGPVLAALVRLLTPLMVLVAVYILWAGGHAPGGAFQAGAILGAAGVLLLLSDTPIRFLRPGWLFRTLLVLGFAVFLTVAVGIMATDRHLLAYPPAWAGSLILLIEGTSMVSIACILVVLFAGGPVGNPSGTTPALPRKQSL